MRSVTSDGKSRPKRPKYPMLLRGRASGKIVLVVGPKQGFVVHCGNSTFAIGESINEDFEAQSSLYEYYDGELTLMND